MRKIYHVSIDIFDVETGDRILHRENYINSEKTPNVFQSDLQFKSEDSATVYMLHNPAGRTKLECECLMDIITYSRERKQALKKAAADEIRAILRKYDMGIWLKYQDEVEPMLYFHDDSQFISEASLMVKVVGRLAELKK